MLNFLLSVTDVPFHRLAASLSKVSVIGFFGLSQRAIVTLLIALAGNND